MPRFNLPDPGKQVYIATFLGRVREYGLHSALGNAARRVDSATLRRELTAHAPADGLALLQGTGVRDEMVFATPTLLRTAPALLTYYRLLLGVSQKGFYAASTGLNAVQAMEKRGEITPQADPLIEDLCTDLNAALATLLHALPNDSLLDNVNHLPLMTLGAQADGSWRTQIGSKATRDVFEAMKGIVRAQNHHYIETAVSITVVNNSQREVTLALAPDPDVVIREDFGATSEYKAAIEIKGGSDYSNIHNRAGEAEKSHQKAHADGAMTCWTIINLDRADMNRLRQESPTTREWVHLDEVLTQNGPSWDRLVQITRAAMGI